MKFNKLFLFALIIVPGFCYSAQSDKNQRLIDAAFYGNLEEVTKLLKDPSVDINAKDKKGFTALMKASTSGNLEILKLLLERNADVNVELHDGWTALMGALSNGYFEIATCLLGKGADINAKLNFDGTALAVASREGKLKTAKFLLEHNADINAQDSSAGRTALILASAQGNLEMVKLLLDHNADVSIKNKSGNNAIMKATDYNNSDVVKLLNSYINEYLPYKESQLKSNKDTISNVLSNAARVSNIVLDYCDNDFGVLKFSEFLKQREKNN